MVCFSEPLPEYVEPSDIFRINLKRALFHQNSGGLEGDANSSELSESKMVKSRDIYDAELLGFNDFFIETSIKVFLTASALGILYGACRLLEYYNIIEKTVH